MKVSVVFLLALCSLSVGVNGWRCYWGPRLNNAYQIDAGARKVVARDTRYYAYMLFWGSWRRLSFTRFRHISVGDAGLWGVGTNYRVYKSTSGRFRSAYGLSMRMVDAGGNKQIVGSTTSSRAYCLKSRTASTYSGGYQRWTYLYRSMKYYSCSPRNGCWGVDRWNRVYYTQNRYFRTLPVWHQVATDPDVLESSPRELRPTNALGRHHLWFGEAMHTLVHNPCSSWEI